MFIIEGSNDFYDGWLTCILKQPQPFPRSEQWLMGYQTAEETGPNAALALGPEIELGHVIIR